MFNLGEAGRRLIQGFEKCVLHPYQDSGGIWTIGWGHTGPNIGPGSMCDQAQADEWFTEDTAKAIAAVNAGLSALAASHVSQNQFDALVAFTFNVGVGAEAHSTLLRKINLLDFSGAAAEFGKWDHVNGVPSTGLDRRRAAERELFLQVASL